MTARIHDIPPDNRRGAEAESRLRRMVEVARRMFVENGFHHTSLDAILARSGGSKATLRKYFGNKAGLLAAVLASSAEARVVEAEAAAKSPDPETALMAFGIVVLRFYLRPDALIIYRSVIAEGYRHAAVAKGLYFGGHARIVAALAGHLQTWSDQGLIHSVDTEGDAERFLNMLRSGPHERGLLGLQTGFTEKLIHSHVAAAVRIFLHGLGPASTRTGVSKRARR
jgi:AcrR family transcriptional regulator